MTHNILNFSKGTFLGIKRKTKPNGKKWDAWQNQKMMPGFVNILRSHFSHFLLQNNLLFFSTLKNLIKKNL